MNKAMKIDVLNVILSDMRKNAQAFSSQVFTKKSVKEYFLNQGTAIAAIAHILKLTVEQSKLDRKTRKEVETTHANQEKSS